jgi:hypothetical protein
MKIVIVGVPVFASRLRESLKAYDSSKSYSQLDTYYSKKDQLKAYSYVQGEFPDFAILSGNPAQVIGDVRELDQVFLDKHPELKESYDIWAK